MSDIHNRISLIKMEIRKVKNDRISILSSINLLKEKKKDLVEQCKGMGINGNSNLVNKIDKIVKEKKKLIDKKIVGIEGKLDELGY